MIQTIANSAQSLITDKCYVDLFGGYTRLAQVKKTVGDKQTILRFPMSCLNADLCYNSKNYLELLPSDKYKSVAYFEQLSSAQSRPITDKYPDKFKAKLWNARLRLVFWYNMKKLGYDTCSISDHVSNDLIECFSQKYALNSPINVHEVQWIVDRVVYHDVNDVFGRYSYSDIAVAFGMPPYEFFAIDFNVIWTVFGDCVLSEPFECQTPIEC